MSAEQYGNYYWGIEVTTDISPDEMIFLMADDVITTSSGALEFVRYGEKNRVNLIIAPGKWKVCFAASIWSGDPVAVEYWKEDKPNQSKKRSKLTKSLRYDILKRDGYKCQICGRNGYDNAILEVDHIIPVAKGGKADLDNLQVLCRECNQGKCDKQ